MTAAEALYSSRAGLRGVTSGARALAPGERRELLGTEWSGTADG
jgi:hypothetical protein